MRPSGTAGLSGGQLALMGLIDGVCAVCSRGIDFVDGWLLMNMRCHCIFAVKKQPSCRTPLSAPFSQRQVSGILC